MSMCIRKTTIWNCFRQKERGHTPCKSIGLFFFLISKQPKITRIRGSSILSRMNHQTPTWVRGEEYFISEYTSLNRLCIKWQLQETKLQHAWSIAYKMSINLRCWMKSSIQLKYIYLHVRVIERGWTLLCHPTSKIILTCTEWD